MMGNALIGRLYHSLRRRKVPILFGAAIKDLLGDTRGITGARVEIEQDAAEGPAGLGRVAPSEGGADSGQELRQAEGLGHVVDRPEIEAHHLVDLARPRREHEHRRRHPRA